MSGYLDPDTMITPGLVGYPEVKRSGPA